MKEQFVTYEIALKLKELGFNEPCMGLFYIKNKEFAKTNYSCSNLVKDNDIILDTPLWQQAIDFLKERKVLVAERWDGWEYGAYDWDDFIYTDTKEEAILKAIEICQKNHS